jgi:hypothetical protein
VVSGRDRSVAIALTVFVIIKVLYIALFYTTLAGVANLGDTADYAESKHLDAESAGLFAIVLSWLSQIIGGQVWIFDLAFLAYSTFLLHRFISDNRIPRLSKQVVYLSFLMPLQILCLTVYSKESFIFVALTTAFWLARASTLAATLIVLISSAFLLFAKPTFVIGYWFFALHSRRRVPGVAASVMLIAVATLLVSISEFAFLKLYSEVAHHFSDGRLTYSKPNVVGLGVPWWAVTRITMTDFFSLGIEPRALFFQFSFHLMLLAAFLSVRARSGGSTFIIAIPTVLIGLASMAPYALFNIGSYARYATPMLLMLVLFLVRNRFTATFEPWTKALRFGRRGLTRPYVGKPRCG